MSNIEPDENRFSRVSPRRYSPGNIAALFLIIGPPIFGLLFSLAITIANRNADTLYTKTVEVVGLVLNPLGALVAYAVGFVPSLIAGFVYSRTVSYRLPVAAITGAALYSFECEVVLSFLAGRNNAGAWQWLFTAYAAGAGALSAFICALIVEISLEK